MIYDNLGRDDKPYEQADELTKALVSGLYTMMVGFDKMSRRTFREGMVAVTAAARDIASRGEVREVERELGLLLAGMTAKRGKGRVT